ncbi:MAG: PGN_0703 family putative restriction endonuclease, partial [Bacteroidota bacterium]
PEHRIRIHTAGPTFIYYNGSDNNSKRNAALRNILFESEYFNEHFLSNAAKAESHRICNENSEDALTWNVFTRLASSQLLSTLLSTLTHISLDNEPELYLWGLKVNLHDSSAPSLFPALISARGIFEKDITKYLTEPDIMLYVPGQVLVLVEAKFTSGNTIASDSATNDVTGEKPKSRDGVLRRYTPTFLPRDSLLSPSSSGPFYSQLYRNLVFAIFMANTLNIRWGLVNLVCDRQFHQRQHKVEFQDPTQFIHALLPEKSRDKFLFYSWERLYADHVANTIELEDLGEYMYNKSANCDKALAI